MNWLNRKHLLKLALIFFGLIYCSISLVNHYCFRTYAWDLGLFNNSVYDYSYFRFNDCMLLLPAHEHFKNYLADHFSIFPMLVSPLMWLFGSYTLLIVQITGILFGGIGIYRVVKLRFEESTYLPLLAIIHFFTIWGIYSALSFDYHDNVMAAMFVPWLFYFFTQKKFGMALLFFLLILSCKENMALWAGFISLGLLAMFWKDISQRKAAAVFALFSFIYFALVIKVLIPSLNIEKGNEYFHFNYNALGKNFSEAFVTIFTKPVYTIKLLFLNQYSDRGVDDLKLNLHYLVLLSGGAFLIYKPQFLIMLIPIFAQKLFNNEWPKWGPGGQYSIEFVPILTMAFFYSINPAIHIFISRIVAVLGICLSIIATMKVMDGYGDPYCPKDRIRFYKMEHYSRNFNVREVHRKLQLIPKDAFVSAQTSLVPHLALRDTIYQFPYIGSANYIALLKQDANKYPLGGEDFIKQINQLKKSPEWETVSEDSNVLIFRKRD